MPHPARSTQPWRRRWGYEPYEYSKVCNEGRRLLVYVSAGFMGGIMFTGQSKQTAGVQGLGSLADWLRVRDFLVFFRSATWT